MYICSCFGITEQQVHEHMRAGACTPRQVASHSGAGTDCGSCVRHIQRLLGRGAGRPSCAGTAERLAPPTGAGSTGAAGAPDRTPAAV